MHQIPTNTAPIEPPPEFIETVCGIYFRSVFLKNKDTIIPQHVHYYDHATYVGSGSVRLWVNDKWEADYKAGSAIPIKAGQQHLFMSLEDNTRLTCVHDTQSAALLKELGH